MILIAFGSNLPFCGAAPAEILPFAARAIAPFAEVTAFSSLYSTPAWPDSTGPEFVNACAAIETDLAPEALLARLHAVEAAFGRRRGETNAARTLDLDLLDYRGVVRLGDDLHLPHPRLEGRAFVLTPLAEIAPAWRSPATGKTVDVLLAALPSADRTAIRRIGVTRQAV